MTRQPKEERDNPFPRNTVVTDSIDRLPSYESIAFKEAETKLIEAAHRFATEEHWSGAAIGLRGRFGSGKTHTCLQLMRSFAREQPTGKAVYTKVQNANRLDLYRNFIGQNLKAEDFKRLISAHILVELQKRSRSGSDQTMPGLAAKELRGRIAAEPEIGIDFVTEDLLPASDLLRSVQFDMEGPARELAGDFSTAYGRIAHPLLSKLAIQWLQGNRLTPGEMRDLGVALPGIEKPEQAWLALRFLLEAFRRAEVPALFCIDEHERVTFRGLEVEKTASWGLLKDLAEAFTGSGHTLIVAGVSDAWDSLPEDVFARIKREDIVEIALDRSEAPKLLRAYERDLGSIFTPAALERLYDVSQYNARQLIDLAHQAWKVWAVERGRPLGPEAIRDVTRSALGDRKRKTSLSEAIEKCAASLTLSLERDASIEDARFDFVLSGPERRRIVVQISESAFLLDEIDHGREIIEAQKRLARERDRIRTCAIMIGYSSFEVRDALEKVVDRVLLYDEAKFPKEFQDFVSRSLEAMSAERPPVPIPQIAAATRVLDASEAARSFHVERVRTELDELGAPQQQRQKEALAKQADEQMASVLGGIENGLRLESEYLIRVTTDGTVNDRGEATLKGIRFVNTQLDGLRRARNLCEMNGAGSEMASLLERYRTEGADAERLWQSLLGPIGMDATSQSSLQRSAARRRELLPQIERRWLNRRRSTMLGVLQPLVFGPLLAALLFTVLLSVEFFQERGARLQAMDSFKTALNGLVDFASNYQLGAGAPVPKEFMANASSYEKAVLNPAIRDLVTADGTGTDVDEVRRAFRRNQDAGGPTASAVEKLHADALKTLESVLKAPTAPLDFFSHHRFELSAIGVLVLFAAGWWQRRSLLKVIDATI